MVDVGQDVKVSLTWGSMHSRNERAYRSKRLDEDVGMTLLQGRDIGRRCKLAYPSMLSEPRAATTKRTSCSLQRLRLLRAKPGFACLSRQSRCVTPRVSFCYIPPRSLSAEQRFARLPVQPEVDPPGPTECSDLLTHPEVWLR